MKRWMGVLLGIGVLLLGWSTFHRVSASEAHCGLAQNRVTILTRGGAGRAFIALDDLGEVPFIDPTTGEAIVSLRSLFTILSGPNTVQWDEANRTAQFQYGSHQLALQVAPKGDVVAARLDGTPYALRAYVCDGHLHAPLRSVTEALGLTLRWYSRERTAVVDPVWTTGVQTPPEAVTPSPKERPAACNTLKQVSLSDLLIHPLDTWGRAVQRTACALVI